MPASAPPINVNEQVAAFGAAFARLGTRERAQGSKAYLKSDLDFYGATVPQIRQAARQFAKENRSLSSDALCDLVRALWETRTYEQRALGVALLEVYLEVLPSQALDLVEELLRRSDTWALVDWLACKVAGGLVRRDARLEQRLRRWAKDENFWIRRSAMLALNDALRAGGGNFALFATFAAGMIHEREFFIRKAIGWVLRDTSKKRPELVYAFLREHIDAVSGLTLREGSKYLPEKQRAELLKRYQERRSGSRRPSR